MIWLKLEVDFENASTLAEESCFWDSPGKVGNEKELQSRTQNYSFSQVYPIVLICPPEIRLFNSIDAQWRPKCQVTVKKEKEKTPKCLTPQNF